MLREQEILISFPEPDSSLKLLRGNLVLYRRTRQAEYPQRHSYPGDASGANLTLGALDGRLR